MALRERQGLAGCQDYQDQGVKQGDRGTQDQQEQAVSQVQQVQPGPRDLLVHKAHQALWRKRMVLRWYQDPQDSQDHKGLRVLLEQMEFRGMLEYLVLLALQEKMDPMGRQVLLGSRGFRDQSVLLDSKGSGAPMEPEAYLTYMVSFLDNRHNQINSSVFPLRVDSSKRKQGGAVQVPD